MTKKQQEKQRKQKQKSNIKKEFGYMRDRMKEEGYYDGRFNSRVIESKKHKKEKHKIKYHHRIDGQRQEGEFND